MPTNETTNFQAALRDLIEKTVDSGVAGVAAMKAAIRTAESMDQGCGCVGACAPQPVQYNKFRTLLKADAPGFTSESLSAIIHSENDRDIIIVHASNKFRELHQQYELTVRPGMRVDRSTIKAQLRYGVLKVTGRTYLSSTPISAMNLVDKTIPVTMA